MSNIATTKEQSKKLIELGLGADTADMYYVEYDGNTYLTSMDKEFDKRTDTYAWSLSRLLELMPEHIVINNKVSNSLKMDKEDGGVGFCYFFSAIDKVDDIIICDMTPIDAAFEMVVYLLENKLIK